MVRAAASRALHWLLAAQITVKNASHPAGKHWDVSVNDYVDDNCDDGYHWDMDAYRCIPDE